MNYYLSSRNNQHSKHYDVKEMHKESSLQFHILAGCNTLKLCYFLIPLYFSKKWSPNSNINKVNTFIYSFNILQLLSKIGK